MNKTTDSFYCVGVSDPMGYIVGPFYYKRKEDAQRKIDTWDKVSKLKESKLLREKINLAHTDDEYATVDVQLSDMSQRVGLDMWELQGIITKSEKRPFLLETLNFENTPK